MKRVYGYARVSTRGQSIEAQVEAIQKRCEYSGYQLIHIYQDKASGKDLERGEWQKMYEDLEINPQGINGIVIYKLDRIGRSISDLLRIVDDLQKRGIDIISISNSLDTTSKEGRLFFYIMAALAEYERELIMERTTLGRELAKEKNVKFGRKEKPVNLDYYRRKRIEGVSVARIAKDLKISRSTLYKKIEEEKKTEENNLIHQNIS